MARHYTAVLNVSLGGDPPTWDCEVTVAYTVSWGAPETPACYHHGGLPADPDLAEDITVTHIEGAVVVGPGLSSEAREIEAHIEGNDRLIAYLIERAYEQEASDAWDAADRARDERIDDDLTGWSR